MSRLLLIFLLFPWPAQAQEIPYYKTPETRRENQAVQFLQKQNLSINNNILIGKTDLNDDLIDEYIIKECHNNILCTYSIIAFKAFDPILLGQFDARKIVIAREKTYGIRHLIVYNQNHNDFAFETAIWNPFGFSFTLQ